MFRMSLLAHRLQIQVRLLDVFGVKEHNHSVVQHPDDQSIPIDKLLIKHGPHSNSHKDVVSASLHLRDVLLIDYSVRRLSFRLSIFHKRALLFKIHRDQVLSPNSQSFIFSQPDSFRVADRSWNRLVSFSNLLVWLISSRLRSDFPGKVSIALFLRFIILVPRLFFILNLLGRPCSASHSTAASFVSGERWNYK